MLAASCLPYCQYLSVSKFNLGFLQTSLLSTLHLLSFSITSAKHSLKSKQPLNAQCQCKMSPQNHFLFHQCLRITETVQSEALNKDPNISTKFCWLYVMYVGTWHWHYIPIPAGTVHFPTFWPSLLIFTNCLLVFTGDLFRSGLTQM